MDISMILRPEAVRNLGTVSSKKRVLQDISEIAEASHGLDRETVFASLQERESLGPTGVGKGVALPHARLEGLEEVMAVFIRLDTPLDFEAADRRPVDLLFCLLAPAEAGFEHLKALALVSRTMRDAEICTKLRANEDATTLYTILTEVPRSQAA